MVFTGTIGYFPLFCSSETCLCVFVCDGLSQHSFDQHLIKDLNVETQLSFKAPNTTCVYKIHSLVMSHEAAPFIVVLQINKIGRENTRVYKNMYKVSSVRK